MCFSLLIFVTVTSMTLTITLYMLYMDLLKLKLDNCKAFHFNIIVNCEIPSYIHKRLELKNGSEPVSTSSIRHIDDGTKILFDYGHRDGEHTAFEPRNRLFKCKRGKWIEENCRGDTWNLGNNGTFPTCREGTSMYSFYPYTKLFRGCS